ncbi:hypothetical protein [Treponema sp.]|uniref:hypothetical protein n=1 Tax=Treponema sp. TaxID=166 RepID=UPI00388EAC22
MRKAIYIFFFIFILFLVGCVTTTEYGKIKKMGTGVAGDKYDAYLAKTEEEALVELCKSLYRKTFRGYKFIAFKDLDIYYEPTRIASYGNSRHGIWGLETQITEGHYKIDYKAIGVENENTLDYLVETWGEFILIVGPVEINKENVQKYKYKKI